MSIEKATQTYNNFVSTFPGLDSADDIPYSIHSDQITTIPHDGSCHIIVTSFPKSASRRLVDMFNSNPFIHEVNVNASLHAVEADSLDSGYLRACHAANYIVHLHTPCYNTLPLFLQTFDIRTIVLTRNIFDVLISTKEHLDKSFHLAHIIQLPDTYRGFSEREKLDFVVDHVTPWLIKFFISWTRAIKNKWVLATWLGFEDVINAPLDSLRKIFDDLKIDDSQFDFKSMVDFTDQKKENFNVGLSGRGGKILSTSQINRVRQIAEPFREFDMTRIGL
jgi:hypothetical protein